MDKQQLLKDYKKQEDKICLSQVLDKIEFSKTREKIEYTDFLDMYQVSLVENFLRKINIKTYQLYGGYEDAERKVLFVYPEKYDEKMLEKNYDKIFDRFYREDQAHSSQIKGTGIGLAIVKDIVTKYHGKISVSANTPKGTIFEIKLPL